MSYRVYLTLEDRWTRYPQEIGSCIIAYVDYRLNHSIYCKYNRENGTTTLYVICKDEFEANLIYDLLALNGGQGVFRSVRKTQGFRTDGNTITTSSGNLWHDRFYRTVRTWLLNTIEKGPQPIGKSAELSRAITEMDFRP